MILMYHKVHPTSPTPWWVNVDAFYRQMWELQSRRVVSLDDYDPSDAEAVVITFDGVYENVLRYAAPILAHFGYTFELFVASDHLGLSNEFDSGEPAARFASLEELQTLQRLGGRVQWHTRSHPDMTSLVDAGRITTELEVPEAFQQFESGCRWFAYPYGRFNQEIREAVAGRFAGAVSCDQGNDSDRFALPRIAVTNETTFKRGTVAAIIASYNYGAFLTEAVESVLRQTIPPDEILIVDDASHDNTEEIARHLVRLYPKRLRFHRNSKNLGIVGNFNNAVSLTSSDYVFFLGADNRARSNYIECCAGELERNPEVAVVYTDFHLFGPCARTIFESIRGGRRGRIVAGEFYHVVFPSETEISAETLKDSNVIHGSSMYRRAVFDAVGGYVDRNDRPEDHDLFSRMLVAGYRAARAGGTSLEYRQHSTDQANIRFVSYATLLHYMERARWLERELEAVRASPWPWLSAHMQPLLSSARKFRDAARDGGLSGAIRATRAYFAWKRAQR